MLNARTATQGLKRWCETRGVQQGVEEFCGWLADNQALHLLPQITERLSYESEQEQVKDTAMLKTAQPLSAEQKQQITATLDASTEETTDETLLAGATLSLRNQTFDASLSRRLQELTNHLHISYE